MSLNDLTKCPGGYRIINFGDVTLSTAPTAVHGIRAMLKEVNGSVPLFCYIKDKVYLGVQTTTLSLWIWGIGHATVSSRADTVTLNDGTAPECMEAYWAILGKYFPSAEEIPYLPRPTAADNGKVLKIVNGEYELVTP